MLADNFGIPEADFSDFKQIFLESLGTAKLVEEHGENLRILDVSEETPNLTGEDKSEHLKKLGAAVHVKAGDSCFVMQPFAQPLGSYYEKSFKPAIEKAGLQPVRADAEIFGTGKIIDQIWRDIKNAKVLIAELTTRNPNVFYELGIAHALQKPVVLVAANEPDVPFDLKHNILSAIRNPEEAIFPGLLLDLLPAQHQPRIDELRLFRDEYEVLRDFYIQTFDPSHKVLRWIVGTVNADSHGDPNTFVAIAGSRPRSRQRYPRTLTRSRS